MHVHHIFQSVSSLTRREENIWRTRPDADPPHFFPFAVELTFAPVNCHAQVNHEMADAVEPELDETERLAAGLKQMEEELAGAKKAGVLAGGRPSRYTYLTTYFRQQTEEERVAEEKEGWDGSYPFLEDTVARYRYARNDVYYKQPGVVLKPVAKAA